MGFLGSKTVQVDVLNLFTDILCLVEFEGKQFDQFMLAYLLLIPKVKKGSQSAFLHFQNTFLQLQEGNKDNLTSKDLPRLK